MIDHTKWSEVERGLLGMQIRHTPTGLYIRKSADLGAAGVGIVWASIGNPQHWLDAIAFLGEN